MIERWKYLYGQDFIRKLMDGTIDLVLLAEDGFGEDNKTYNPEVFAAVCDVAKQMGYASPEEEAKKAVKEASVYLFGVA